jgi:hypothetical protein
MLFGKRRLFSGNNLKFRNLVYGDCSGQVKAPCHFLHIKRGKESFFGLCFQCFGGESFGLKFLKNKKFILALYSL